MFMPFFIMCFRSVVPCEVSFYEVHERRMQWRNNRLLGDLVGVSAWRQVLACVGVKTSA